MEFVLDERRRVKWPIAVLVPVDGGDVEEQRITGLFQLLPQDEWNETLDRGGDAPDRALLEKVWVGWEGVHDKDKKPLPFSAEALQRLLNVPYVRLAAVRAFNQAQVGAKVKN